MIRTSLIALAIATQMTLLSATSTPADADAGLPSISVSDSTVRLGRTVTVSGEGPLLRRVALQLRTAENGWQEIATASTGTDGGYSFAAPGWRGTHLLRVVVPGTLVSATAVSDTVSVTVKMPYRPRGRRSDWTWLSHRGARWDPCREITYRINPRGGYANAVADIRRTFRRVGQVTGFRFRYLGTTTRGVRRDEWDQHPAGTDVLVDWQTPSQEPGLARTIAGIGGHWVLDGRRFNGYVLLDRTEVLPRGTWRQLIAHEAGHVLGLGHARARRQLMYGVSSPLNVRWGNGDLTALDRVGASRGCLAEPAPRSLAGAEPDRAEAS